MIDILFTPSATPAIREMLGASYQTRSRDPDSGEKSLRHRRNPACRIAMAVPGEDGTLRTRWTPEAVERALEVFRGVSKGDSTVLSAIEQLERARDGEP